MLCLIWLLEVAIIVAVIWWKNKQPPMTLGEQFYELSCVSQRANSFLMNKIEHQPYNGVKDK